MSMLPSGYQLPIAATMATLAIAASGLALTSNSTAHRKKKRRAKAKYNRGLRALPTFSYFRRLFG